jgi:hypothetical protein
VPDRPAAATSPPATALPDEELLLDASVRLSEAALDARAAGAEVTAAATSPRLGLRALRDPVAAGLALFSAARVLTDEHGLGFAAAGGPVGEAVRWFGTAAHRRPAAVRMAADALELRVRAAENHHPNLTSPLVAALTEAIRSGSKAGTALALRTLIERLGTTRALTTLSPVSMELLAWAALLDENPLNDDFSWAVLRGEMVPVDPLAGTPIALVRWLQSTAGRAYPAEPDPLLAEALTRSANDIASYLDDISALGNHGAVLLRRIAGTDGSTRYVLLLPGTSFGRFSNNTPQDVVGALDNTLRTDTTYTRSAGQLLRSAGVPPGSELMIVGHSLGGIAALNLAMDPEFVSRYRLTHTVAVGSPIDSKRPVDPDTKVISLVNNYDIIPDLDGRGPASPDDIPASWTELAWTDSTFDYPLSHAPQAYALSLGGLAAGHRDTANELIARYDGEILGNQLYMVRDQ